MQAISARICVLVVKGFKEGFFKILILFAEQIHWKRILIKSLITNQTKHILKHFKNYVFTSWRA